MTAPAAHEELWGPAVDPADFADVVDAVAELTAAMKLVVRALAPSEAAEHIGRAEALLGRRN